MAVCFGYISYADRYLFVDETVRCYRRLYWHYLAWHFTSYINFPLSTNGQVSSVGTIVSAGYGFICGAYMIIPGFQKDCKM